MNDKTSWEFEFYTEKKKTTYIIVLFYDKKEIMNVQIYMGYLFMWNEHIKIY